MFYPGYSCILILKGWCSTDNSFIWVITLFKIIHCYFRTQMKTLWYEWTNLGISEKKILL